MIREAFRARRLATEHDPTIRLRFDLTILSLSLSLVSIVSIHAKGLSTYFERLFIRSEKARRIARFVSPFEGSIVRVFFGENASELKVIFLRRSRRETF